MKKLFFPVLLAMILTSHPLEAAPAKGYLNPDEIKSILDQYSNPVKLEDVVAVFGRPTEIDGIIWSWYFGEYSTLIMFQRMGGTDLMIAPKLVQMFDSQYARDDCLRTTMHRFNAIFAGKIPRSDNPRRDMVLRDGASSATWDLDDNRIFTVFNYQFNGLPCLMYQYTTKEP